MMIVVVSQSVEMIPFAWRLVLEGHDVQLIVLKDSAEGAWAGQEKLSRPIIGEQKRDPAVRKVVFETLQQAGENGVLMTDSHQWAKEAREFPVPMVVGPLQTGGGRKPPPAAITFGAWFNGTLTSSPHIIVADQGTWPGGALGPRMVGGMTLIAPRTNQDRYTEIWQPFWEELSKRGYRGLVRMNFPEEGKTPTVDDLYTGWGWLHSHAFISELGEDGPGFGATLMGAHPGLPSIFTVALPVSMAPWPGMIPHRNGWPRTPIPQESLGGEVFFHSIQFDNGKVWTGAPQKEPEGGLVGVARGSGNSIGLARGRALIQAQLLARGLREPQFRPDVAGAVEQVVATLEARGLGIV